MLKHYGVKVVGGGVRKDDLRKVLAGLEIGSSRAEAAVDSWDAGFKTPRFQDLIKEAAKAVAEQMSDQILKSAHTYASGWLLNKMRSLYDVEPEGNDLEDLEIVVMLGALKELQISTKKKFPGL
jgi:hypothetical protein